MGVLWCVWVAVVAVMMVVPPATPCSCRLSHPQHHVCDADFVVLTRVRRLSKTPSGNMAYKVKVKKLLKGSEKVEVILQKGLIYTPPGTCMAEIQPRTVHVITGTVAGGKPWVDLCDYAAPIRSLTPKMKKGFRLLYQNGCDCPIMPCYFREPCPKASFFCRWETFFEKTDCQGRQSMCLRGPDGTCEWLRGHRYQTCMKSLRAVHNATEVDINNTQDNRISRDVRITTGRHKPSRYGYKRIPGHGGRPLRPGRPRRPGRQLRPRNVFSRIGYVPKNG